MSCRHAFSANNATTTINAETAERAEPRFSAISASSALIVVTAVLLRNGRHLPWTERVEEGARLLEIELRVPCLDAKKEAIAAGKREPRHVEDRVIRHRKAVQGQHAEHSRQGGDEDGALEDDWDERRPAEQRPAADVPGILDSR